MLFRSGGVVVDVPGKWFQGLSFAVDTWELHYFNKVGSAGYQVLVDFFPERVVRAASKAASDPAGYAGPITGFNSTAINLARYDTRGVDIAEPRGHGLVRDRRQQRHAVHWDTVLSQPAGDGFGAVGRCRCAGAMWRMHEVCCGVGEGRGPGG